MNKDYIQTYDDEVRCQFWWDAFKIVVPPVFEEESNQPTQFGTATLEYREDEDFVQSEVKSLRQQVAALKAVLDAWNNVEQEPVAWVDLEQWQSGEYDCFTSKKVADYMTPLYTAPVRKKDLTDDEISKLRHKIDWTAEWSYVNFARAVIQADREKNK